MSPTGAVFVGGTNRGWGSTGSRPFAIERVDWTGKVPFEIQQMRVTPTGFELTFTQPVDAVAAGKPESYDLSSYTYIYRSEYGSPEVDHTTPKITGLSVSADGLKVQMEVEGRQLGHVHELHAKGVRATDGNELLHEKAYYTLNRIPE